MRTPNLTLDLKPTVDNKINHKIESLLAYIFKKMNYPEIKQGDITVKSEEVKNYSRPVRTYRFKGKLLLRMFPSIDLTYKFESPYIKN